MKKVIVVIMLTLVFAGMTVQARPRKVRIKTPKTPVCVTDGGAVAGSIFIPGLGHFLKGRNGAGTTFLLSEAVLVTGTVFSYKINRDQLAILKQPGISEGEFTKANNNYYATRVSFYVGLGASICMHVINVVTAGTMRNESKFALSPTVYETPGNLGMGMALTYKF